MKLTLSFNNAADIDTDCLAVVVLDQSLNNKDKKPEPKVQCDVENVRNAATDLIANGEVTGKAFETVLLHRPQGIKAKRLLLLGGGKAKSFSSSELRKLASAAVRFAKSKSLKSFVSSPPPAPASPSVPSAKARSSATTIPIPTRATAKTSTWTKSCVGQSLAKRRRSG